MTARAMLRATFLHLHGIGMKRERQLWDSRILYWDDLKSNRDLPLLNGRRATIAAELERSELALSSGDSAFFAGRLPMNQHWRIAMTFPSETMFLDIETTGLSLYYDSITLVGWGMGGKYGVHLAHDPSDEFLQALKAAKVLVTFNGSHFDLPFLRTIFQGTTFPKAHVDLRYAARRIGLKGSQKEVERALGHKRPPSVSTMSGATAPSLWAQYQRGDLRSLRRLLTYNHADIDGMRRILMIVIAEAMRSCGFPSNHRRALLPSWPRTSLRLVGDSGSSSAGGIRLTPFIGTVGPRITLKHLGETSLAKPAKIIGIDLTGSESRPSGWAVVDGSRTLTARIATDAELFERSLNESPSLVSIDAPLSLPYGRLTTLDSDPTRALYGITRECERVLKRRGVNVYPCLIRSMQALTARGIRLAAHFRSFGIPVIESFPGAVQDILGIPRKRDSIEWLRQGLIEYGLTGPFTTNSVSHDELDAISSAIVGQMAWTHQVESLGNDQEGYLIIPRIDAERDVYDLQVIGLSGGSASGKTTAASLLREHGFKDLSFSATLADLLHQQGIPVTRAKLQRFGADVQVERGQRWLDECIAREIGRTGRYVVDGLRFPDDHAFFVERYGGSFLHIFIHADLETRRNRFLRRGGTENEFTEVEDSEMEAQVPLMQELAHTVIVNSGDLAALDRKIKRTLHCSIP